MILFEVSANGRNMMESLAANVYLRHLCLKSVSLILDAGLHPKIGEQEDSEPHYHRVPQRTLLHTSTPPTLLFGIEGAHPMMDLGSHSSLYPPYATPNDIPFKQIEHRKLTCLFTSPREPHLTPLSSSLTSSSRRGLPFQDSSLDTT